MSEEVNVNTGNRRNWLWVLLALLLVVGLILAIAAMLGAFSPKPVDPPPTNEWVQISWTNAGVTCTAELNRSTQETRNVDCQGVYPPVSPTQGTQGEDNSWNPLVCVTTGDNPRVLPPVYPTKQGTEYVYDLDMLASVVKITPTTCSLVVSGQDEHHLHADRVTYVYADGMGDGEMCVGTDCQHLGGGFVPTKGKVEQWEGPTTVTLEFGGNPSSGAIVKVVRP